MNETATRAGTPRVLRAGPLSLLFDAGALRDVRLGEREVLRRVYVALRDPSWVTIPLEISDLVVEEGEQAFAVDFVADHCHGPIHFRWKGAVRGGADGTVRFEMDGEAISTFKRNRVGLCVLHPPDEYAGQPCLVESVDQVVETSFPRLISPHQPFLDLRAISHEVEAGVRAQVRFEGELFETEDQRNWGDASYKTYGTPLALPRPVEVRAGTRLRQAVTLSVAPAVMRPLRQRPGAEVTLALEETRVAALPKLGVALAPRTELLLPRERERLAALRLSYLRAELVPSRADFVAAFERACGDAEALNVPIAWALCLGDKPDEEIALFAHALHRKRVATTLIAVLPLAGPITRADGVSALRAVLKDIDSASPIAGGSNLHFTEVNRNREVAEIVDVVCFPSCPQIHLADDVTLVENLATVPWIAQTARSFAGTRPLDLSPISLKRAPRPMPAAGTNDLASIGRHIDARQAMPLGAAWTVGHLAFTAEAGFARATYFETTGARGVMAGDAGPLPPAQFATDAGAVFPLYHVLADVGEFGEGGSPAVLLLRSSRPSEVLGLALRQQGRMRALIANLTNTEQNVRLPSILVGGRSRRLDHATSRVATRTPEVFRAAAPAGTVGDLVRLSPHEVLRVDL